MGFPFQVFSAGRIHHRDVRYENTYKACHSQVENSPFKRLFLFPSRWRNSALAQILNPIHEKILPFFEKVPPVHGTPELVFFFRFASFGNKPVSLTFLSFCLKLLVHSKSTNGIPLEVPSPMSLSSAPVHPPQALPLEQARRTGTWNYYPDMQGIVILQGSSHEAISIMTYC